MATLQDARDSLADFDKEWEAWENFLGPLHDDLQFRGKVAFLQELDAVLGRLDELSDEHDHIPARSAVAEKLDIVGMKVLREQFAQVRGALDAVVDELSTELHDPVLLAEFDGLPSAVERFAFVASVVERSDRILQFEADKSRVHAGPSDDEDDGDDGDDDDGDGDDDGDDPEDARPRTPPILSDIGDDHVLSAQRMRRLAEELPLRIDTSPSGHAIEIDAPDAGSRARIEAEVRAAVGGGTPSAVGTVAQTLAGAYGNIVSIASLVLAEARDRDVADQALTAMWSVFDPVFDPVLDPVTDPEEIQLALGRARDNADALDEDLFHQFGLPITYALGIIDIYVELSSFARNPTAERLGDVAMVVLKAVELMAATADQFEHLLRRGTFRVLRAAGGIVALVMFLLDLKAGAAGIKDAIRYRDYSVAFGQTGRLVAGGALFYMMLPGVAVSGPVAAVVIGALIASQLVIDLTRNKPLEDFASACMFGKAPATSNDPGKIEYLFGTVAQPHIPFQRERLRTMFNPLGFRITRPGVHVLEHARWRERDEFGQVTQDPPLALPADARLIVRRLATDGTWVELESDPDDDYPFQLYNLQVGGRASTDALDDHVGDWVYLEVELPGGLAGGQSSELREYAMVP